MSQGSVPACHDRSKRRERSCESDLAVAVTAASPDGSSAGQSPDAMKSSHSSEGLDVSATSCGFAAQHTQEELFADIAFRGRKAEISFNPAMQCIIIRKTESRLSRKQSASTAATSAAPMGAGSKARTSSSSSSSPLPVAEACSSDRGKFSTPTTRKQPNGTVLLILPISYTLNIETEYECHLRQQMRQSNDEDNTGSDIDSETRVLRHLGCFGEENHTQSVFYHSRSTTFGIGSGGGVLHAHSPTLSNDSGVPIFSGGVSPQNTGHDVSVHRHFRHGSGVSAMHQGFALKSYTNSHLDPTKSAATRTKFYLHYVNFAAGNRRVIRSLAFYSVQPYEEGCPLWRVVSAILGGVYREGVKSILVFVSPVSGSGKGKVVFEKQVKPILHYSRHRISALITTRQHFCEDYIADLNNDLSSNHVIATAGGDGMVHEVVNGLYRRREAIKALLRKRREEEAKVTQAEASASTAPAVERIDGPMSVQVPGDGHYFATSSALISEDQEDELIDAITPPLATIAAGSACGLAKSLDVLTPARAALALVHLEKVTFDLLKMDFVENSTLKSNVERKMGKAEARRAKENFARDSHSKASSSHAERAEEACDPLVETNSGIIYTDPVSYAVGAPAYHSRISFMSASFGIPNEIDRGSEKLRWMGNSRFAAYAVFVIMKGIPLYRMRVRYLPWVSNTGVTVAKTVDSGSIPSEEELPRCTMRTECPHCATHRAQDSTPSHDEVDFDDLSLPWATLDDRFYSVLVTNLRDAAQDMMVAPLQHMNDGAMDLIYSQQVSNVSTRTEFVKYFLALEKGEHIHSAFVQYVKVRAVEIQPLEGIVMSDGEMMPLSTVRITKLRSAVKLVRWR